jgi:hypothetical protein
MLSKGFIGRPVLNPQTLVPASILSDFQAVIESSKAGSPGDAKITGAPLRLAFAKWLKAKTPLQATDRYLSSGQTKGGRETIRTCRQSSHAMSLSLGSWFGVGEAMPIRKVPPIKIPEGIPKWDPLIVART